MITLGSLESARVDFLVLIELFSLGVMAEVLRANIGSKSAITFQSNAGRLTQNFR